MKTLNSRSGFTLLEVLVVVMIITILATIVGLQLADKPDEAKVATTNAQIQTFGTALQLYRMHNGRLPTQEQGLDALAQAPTVKPLPTSYPNDGYLQTRTLPRDPWGNEYVYLIPGPAGEKYLIMSYGADGEPGGDGGDADITNIMIP